MVPEPGLSPSGLGPYGPPAPEPIPGLPVTDPALGLPAVPVGLDPAGVAWAPPPEPEPERLPVVPMEYHQFYRAPAFRWWKPLLAIVTFGGVELIISVAAGVIWFFWALATGAGTSAEAFMQSALGFVMNNVLVAVGLPLALLAHWLVMRQRPRWLSSVAGQFRWPLFWRFGLIVAPVLVGFTLIEMWAGGGPGPLGWNPDSLVLLIAVVATTPFQAAAEEYSVRGLLGRGVGSWFSNRWVALGVSTLVSSVAFMLLHGAGDPWLNLDYFMIGVVFSLITWRTGGLEAAVMMHIVTNLAGEALLPFSSDVLTHMFDRQAGVAGPEVLIQVGVTAGVAALLWWQASRLSVTRAAAPAGGAPAQLPA